MANWLNVLNKRMAKYPLRLAVGFSMFKAGTADIFTQSILEKRPEVDLKRTSVFLTFGCIYQGFFQYFLWNIAFERIFPGASLVVNSFLYFYLFSVYIFRSRICFIAENNNFKQKKLTRKFLVYIFKYK